MLSQTRGHRRPEARNPRSGPESVTSTGCASAGRPVGSQGRPARQRISVRAFAPTKASRASPSTVPSQTSRPSSRSSAPASDGGSQTRPISERPSSSDGANGAGGVLLADPAVGDELDDAARRVVEVDRLRVPVREVEHRLARLAVGQELARAREPTRAPPRSGRPGRGRRSGRTASPPTARARASSRPPGLRRRRLRAVRRSVRAGPVEPRELRQQRSRGLEAEAQEGRVGHRHAVDSTTGRRRRRSRIARTESAEFVPVPGKTYVDFGSEIACVSAAQTSARSTRSSFASAPR